MDKTFQSILNWVYNSFKKDASKMLIWTGVAGWTLSSLAQICAIKFNPDIPKEQKSFLIPQEAMDAFINIASFFLITQVAKKSVSKLFSTGKFATADVREFLNKNKDSLKDKIGKFNFDLDEVLKVVPGFPKESYWASKNFYTTVATVSAGILSSNIVTPYLRNKVASNMHKKTITQNELSQETRKPQLEKATTFRAYSPYSKVYSGNLKI